jgi:hypothetical protein
MGHQERFAEALAHLRASRLEDAEGLLAKLLFEIPNEPRLLRSYAETISKQGRHRQSVEVMRRAVQVDPEHADGWRMLGHALFLLKEDAEAQAALERSDELAPMCAQTLWKLHQCHLRQGHFVEGWDLYRWGSVLGAQKVRTLAPPWDGRRDLNGKTLFVWPDWGFGDCIQFIRLIPLLKQRYPGVKIIFEAHPAMMRLLAGNDLGIDEMFAESPAGSVPCRFDEHLSLLWLPYVLGLQIEDLSAAPRPYLKANAGLVRHWRKALDLPKEDFKIGICWKGNPYHSLDAERSMAPEEMKSIFELGFCEGISVVRLLEAFLPVKDWADTAAVLAGFDLLISVDTGVVHLGGAMGIETWMLAAWNSDVRWMLDREDSPWYPSLRIFRQRSPCEWAPVIARVMRELAARVVSHRPGRPLPDVFGDWLEPAAPCVASEALDPPRDEVEFRIECAEPVPVSIGKALKWDLPEYAGVGE